MCFYKMLGFLEDCFILVTKIFLKEVDKTKSYFGKICKHGIESLEQSLKLFALQNLNMWLGLYIFCYFLPGKLESSLAWLPSTSTAYIGIKPFAYRFCADTLQSECANLRRPRRRMGLVTVGFCWSHGGIDVSHGSLHRHLSEEHQKSHSSGNRHRRARGGTRLRVGDDREERISEEPAKIPLKYVKFSIN